MVSQRYNGHGLSVSWGEVALKTREREHQFRPFPTNESARIVMVRGSQSRGVKWPSRPIVMVRGSQSRGLKWPSRPERERGSDDDSSPLLLLPKQKGRVASGADTMMKGGR